MQIGQLGFMMVCDYVVAMALEDAGTLFE